MAGEVLLVILLLSCEGYQSSLGWEVANITMNTRLTCAVPLGMDSGWLENGIVKVKSTKDGFNHPGRSRVDGDTAWVPRMTSINQILQIQMESVTNITKIIIQGHPTQEKWISRFKLSFSLNGFTWEHDPQMYKADEKGDLTSIKLYKCLTVRYIRLKPIEWHQSVALRLSVYGCFTEYTQCGIRFLPTNRRIVKRVVGGSPVVPNSWPWVINLLINGTAQYCGGSLISPSWVLTAAHCFDSMPTLDNWKIIAGDHDLARFDGYENVLNTQKLFIHPDYINGNETHPGRNDIALIRLRYPLRFHKRVHAVCLPDEETIFPDGTPCYVTGWGHTKYNGSSSRLLLEAVVNTIPKDICNFNYSFSSDINHNNICAGFAEGQVDSCTGDSGGPLVCQDPNGMWILIGIVNWGIECARPYKYGVYTEIRKMLPFIRDTLDGWKG